MPGGGGIIPVLFIYLFFWGGTIDGWQDDIIIEYVGILEERNPRSTTIDDKKGKKTHQEEMVDNDYYCTVPPVGREEEEAAAAVAVRTTWSRRYLPIFVA